MDAADLTSCSKIFLRTIEDYGLAGEWHWTFASGEQRWSPGFFRLLGLDPSVTTASYDLFVDLLHPDHRAQLARSSEIVQGHVSPRATVRLIRPIGELRVLSLLSELRVSPEGRPLSLNGVALDVTDRERLRQAQAAEQRRRQALYLTSYTATYSLGLDLVHHFPAEVAQVHGLSLEEIQVDPFLMLVPEDRGPFRDRGWERHDRHMRFQGMPRERLANGEVVKFRLVAVPVWSVTGEYRGWTGINTRSTNPARPPAGPTPPRMPPCDGASNRRCGAITCGWPAGCSTGRWRRSRRPAACRSRRCGASRTTSKARAPARATRPSTHRP